MTTETMTDDKAVRRICDEIVARAAALMVEGGASIPMALDRLLTYAAAQACHIEGSQNAAAAFRHLADRIEDGIFAQLEAPATGQKH